MLCGACFALGALATLLGDHLFSAPSTPRPENSRPTAVLPLSDRSALTIKSPEPPWGVLEYEPLPLENSADEQSDAVERFQKTRWCFENCDRAQLLGLLNSCELQTAQRNCLLDTNRWEPLANGYAIFPDDPTVLGLSKALCMAIGSPWWTPAAKSFIFASISPPMSYSPRMAATCDNPGF